MVQKDFLKLKLLPQMKNSKSIQIYITLAAVLFILSGYNFKKSDKPTVHFYLTPRNVNYGWADKGVLKFPTNQQSIKAPYLKRSFITDVQVDSVYELFYFREIGSKKLLTRLDLSHQNIINQEFLFPRVLIIIEYAGMNDSLQVDRNYNVLYKTKTYQINSAFKDYLLSKMPPEIKDNWINNKSGR